MPRPLGRCVRRLVASLAVALGTLTVAVPAVAVATTPPPTAPDPATMGSNDFIPEDVNIGDCLSALPRPECGSEARGGYHQYVTLLVLLAATVFIGWRITKAVRARDRATTPTDT